MTIDRRTRVDYGSLFLAQYISVRTGACHHAGIRRDQPAYAWREPDQLARDKISFHDSPSFR